MCADCRGVLLTWHLSQCKVCETYLRLRKLTQHSASNNYQFRGQNLLDETHFEQVRILEYFIGSTRTN